MSGVAVVEKFAFADCEALTDFECDKLEIIGEMAFKCCKSLRSINLSSAKIVERSAFAGCAALTNVEFGKELERVEEKAFCRCTSLERITIPLKDSMIAADGIFRMCKKLKHVDLVEEAVLLYMTLSPLYYWKNGKMIWIEKLMQSIRFSPLHVLGMLMILMMWGERLWRYEGGFHHFLAKLFATKPSIATY